MKRCFLRDFWNVYGRNIAKDLSLSKVLGLAVLIFITSLILSFIKFLGISKKRMMTDDD